MIYTDTKSSAIADKPRDAGL